MSETTTFGGHTAKEVAELCDMLALSADRMTNSYSETASIARRARDAILHLLNEVEEWQSEARTIGEGSAHNAAIDREEVAYWKDRVNAR